jgi:hypothetical protein
MYRGGCRRPAPIIECREAMLEKADECGPQGVVQGRGERVFHS